MNIFGQNLANSRETGHEKWFICQTPSGRGTAVIRNRFCAGFEEENRICRKRVPQKNFIVHKTALALKKIPRKKDLDFSKKPVIT